MGFATQANTIRNRFATLWPGLRPGVPVAFDNTAFDPAVDAVDGMGNPIPWVRLTIVPGDGFQASLGTPKVWRSTGVVSVQVFVPAGDGDGTANELADDAASIFRGVNDSGVTFRAPALTRLGLDAAGAWYELNLATPYLSDQAI
jgi:hypothetical protein